MLLFYTEGGRGVKVNDRTRKGAGNPGRLFDNCGMIGHDGADAARCGAVNRKVAGDRH
jgi:hypothetical protein